MALPPEKTKRLRYDGIETYLGLQLDPLDSATTITFQETLKHDGGAFLVPTLAADEYMSLSILSPNYVLREIVYLVAYSENTNTGTITRGEEGTAKATHPVGVKVVHAPTAVDFGDLAVHIADPNAHSEAIHLAADAEAKEEVGIHENRQIRPDPHPQYAQKGSIVINNGETLYVENGGDIFIRQGGKITVEGDLIIQNTGRFFINGHQIIVSKNPPTTPLPNVVWIQTFGP